MIQAEILNMVIDRWRRTCILLLSDEALEDIVTES
jgi:hypothetical protein